MSWFEDAWRYRDEVLYREQFGSGSLRTIHPIPYEAFAQLGFDQVDPRWLHCGVLTFPPAGGRPHFTFVTSGLSNAWEDDRPDPESRSGLGIELVIDNASDEHWVKDVLLRLSAAQLLIGAGRYSGARILADGDRIRVGPDTFGEQSVMTGLLATKVTDLQLPSGKFELIRLFAITDAERELAVRDGAESLVAVLGRRTTYPVNDVHRDGVD